METYLQSPTPEDNKAVAFINKYLYWMANVNNEVKYFHEAFGTVMGNHFWHKLMSMRGRLGTAAADVWLWYEMSNTYRAQLMHYINQSGYKA